MLRSYANKYHFSILDGGNPLSEIFGENLVEWWRPEELSGYTAGDPLNNGWASVGSFGSDYDQSSPGARPTIILSNYNNQKGLQFDGLTTYINSKRPKNDYGFINKQGFESFQFIVYESLDDSSTTSILSNMDIALLNRNGIVIFDVSSEIRTRTGSLGGYQSAINGILPKNTNELNLLMFETEIPTGTTDPNSTKAGINSDSFSFSNSLTQPTGTNNPDHQLTVGRVNGSGGSFYSNINFFEHGIVNRKTTAQERLSLLNYLQNKYGGTFPIS